MNTPSPADPSRRRAIALVGGGLVLAGCSSALPPEALEAWQSPSAGQGDPRDLRRFMLAHALLAPNPHNRQPWLADLQRDGEIALVCDPDRLLPATDPFGRQIVIGCGAFVELAVMAAAERGHRVEVAAFPDGEPEPSTLPGGRVVARLTLRPEAGLPRDPLFAQIARRHTDRGVYDMHRPVAPAAWARLAAPARAAGLVAGVVGEPGAMDAVRRITRAAFEAEMTTAHTWLESARLLRIGPDEIARHRDGIALLGLMPRVMSRVGLYDRFEVPVRGTSGHARVMEHWAPQETGSGYLWIASRGNSRRDQLAAGRAYVRAHLEATALGLAMQPLSQALQEFAEVRPQYEALHRGLGVDPASTTVQMLARVGHAIAPSGPAPRRPLKEVTRA